LGIGRVYVPEPPNPLLADSECWCEGCIMLVTEPEPVFGIEKPPLLLKEF